MDTIISYEEPLYVDETSLKAVHDLGQGTNSSVSLKLHPRLQYYAKKTSSMHLKENLKKDLRIMLQFRNHPRIVQALSDRVHLGMLLKDCYIYIEYASEGTLRDFCGERLPENVIGRTTRMILEGLEALHSRGCVHCDLKPSNVFLFPSKAIGEPWDVKIGDFCLSKEPNNTDSGSLYPGTKQYMPPDKVIGPAFDIWSLGCVVFEMFGGKPKRKGESYVWRLYQDISPVAIDFLRRCHAWDPLRRGTATELLKHPLIKQRVSVLQPILTRFRKTQVTQVTQQDYLNRLHIIKSLVAFLDDVDGSYQKTTRSSEDGSEISRVRAESLINCGKEDIKSDL